MRKEIINGKSIPYHNTVEEIAELLSTGDMSDFAVACEALSYYSDEKAFVLLKSFITHKDKYKRLCVLKTVFRHPMSFRIKSFLEECILSDDFLFVHNGLGAVGQYRIEVSEQAVLSAVRKNLTDLHYTDLYALELLSASTDNFLNIIQLFKRPKACGQKEILSSGVSRWIIISYMNTYYRELAGIWHPTGSKEVVRVDFFTDIQPMGKSAV